MIADDELRQEAVERLNERRGFLVHLGAYLIVNAALLVLWTLSGGGYYWPVWTAFGWGIGVAFHAWGVLVGHTEPSETRIKREMRRMREGIGRPRPVP